MQRDIGFPWSRELVERTLKIVGGSLAATQHVLTQQGKIAGNLAGGFHHAFYYKGEGFCVFNDIVICAKYAMEHHKGTVDRVLVVDLDVHQGNGTASMCRNINNIYTFSVHAKNNYPFVKETSDYDIELEDHTEDGQYLDILQDALDKVFAISNPDLVLYQAGVDSLKGDRWGKLSLTRNGLIQRNKMVYEKCAENNIPIVCFMGGGYHSDIQISAEAHVDVYESAKEYFV